MCIIGVGTRVKEGITWGRVDIVLTFINSCIQLPWIGIKFTLISGLFLFFVSFVLLG